MRRCIECDKKIPENHFRCDACASKAVMDTSKRNMPVGTTLWKNANGNYVPKPSHK